MLKNVVAWRKEFGIESLLDEDLGTEQEKVVYMQELIKKAIWFVTTLMVNMETKNYTTKHSQLIRNEPSFFDGGFSFLKKNIRKLDFSPDGICTIVQVIDFKNSPGLFQWELRQTTNQATGKEAHRPRSTSCVTTYHYELEKMCSKVMKLKEKENWMTHTGLFLVFNKLPQLDAFIYNTIFRDCYRLLSKED